MLPVIPPLHEGAHRVIFGSRQQDDYIPLPASVDNDGLVMTEWELSEEEYQKIYVGGHICIWLYNTEVEVGRPLTPIRIEAVLPGTPAKES